MIIGLDAGGTNYDAVLVDSNGVVDSAKVPAMESGDGIRSLLSDLLENHSPGEVERVVVSTTLILNSALQRRLPECTNVLVPGVGLNPMYAFHGDENIVAKGCVDHRGRVTEDVESGRNPGNDVVAVTCKFSTRNPALENTLRDSLQYEHMALGHEAGGRLGFLDRAATTVFNAKAKPIFHQFEERLAGALDGVGVDASVYYLKGDAAMLSREKALSTPSHILRSGPAASSLGLVALSGVRNAVCVDVGGTTTDIAVVEDGYPRLKEGFEVHGLRTYYEGVDSVDLSVGGDTRVISEGLGAVREGNAAAFGGKHPTPTDALHVVGECSLGDTERARKSFESLGDPGEIAQSVLKEFVDRIAGGVREICGGEGPRTLVAGGVLAPYVADRVAEHVSWIDEVVVPEYAGVCGAVGCAAARVSVKTTVHIDTQRAKMTVSSEGSEKVVDVGRGRQFSDEEAESLVREEAMRAAVNAGASGNVETEILDMRKFNVVERSRVRGQIVDATAQAVPGLNEIFGGSQ